MKVFIGNYPFDLEEEELRAILDPYGLSSLDFVRDPAGGSRGFAFAELERGEAAVRDLDERIIGGRELRVRPAVERPARNQAASRPGYEPEGKTQK